MKHDKALELVAEVNASITRLAEELDSHDRRAAYMRMIEQYQKYGMGRYSFRNSILIAMQNPKATNTFGYKFWVAHGYVPQKGKGIVIVQPRPFKKVDAKTGEEKQGMSFSDIYVWDVTGVEPMKDKEQKSIPDYTFKWYSDVRPAELHAATVRFAEKCGIKVREREHIIGNARGESHGGAISVLSDSGTATLFHELTHELLQHKGDQNSSATRELEAESATYLLCDAFKLDTEHTLNYLINWSATGDKVRASMSRITSVVNKIIIGIRKELDGEEDAHSES